MIHKAAYFFPHCAACSAVVPSNEGPWLNLHGKAAKTIENLYICSVCVFARYCNTECQKNHWSEHKKTCTKLKTTSGELILKVDLIIRNSLTITPGKAVVYLDEKLNFLKFDQLSKAEGRLLVKVKVGTQSAGSHSYLGCTKDICDWKTMFKNIHSKGHYPEEQIADLISRALILEKRYEEAFEMVATREKLLPGQHDRFFERAIEVMRARQVSLKKIAKCGKILNKTKQDVKLVTALIDKLPEEVRKQLFSLVQMPAKIAQGTITDDEKPINVDVRASLTLAFAVNLVQNGFIDYGFRHIGNWAVNSQMKAVFCASIRHALVAQNVPDEKIAQLFLSNYIGDEEELECLLESISQISM